MYLMKKIKIKLNKNAFKLDSHIETFQGNRKVPIFALPKN